MSHKHRQHHHHHHHHHESNHFMEFINNNSKLHRKFQQFVATDYVLVNFSIDRHWKPALPIDNLHEVLSWHYSAIKEVIKRVSPKEYKIDKIVNLYYSRSENNGNIDNILTEYNIDTSFATTLALFKDGKIVKSKTENPSVDPFPQNEVSKDHIDERSALFAQIFLEEAFPYVLRFPFDTSPPPSFSIQ